MTPLRSQAVVAYYTITDAAEDAATKKRARGGELMGVGSALIVVVQLVVLMGILIGSFIPSCTDNAHCPDGKFCSRSEDATTGVCDFCGGANPLPRQELDGPCRFAPSPYGGEWSVKDTECSMLNNAMDPNFAGFNRTLVADMCASPTERVGLNGKGQLQPYSRRSVISWCEACVHPIDGVVNPTTAESEPTNNVYAMNQLDWVALMLASSIVGLSAVGELKDICLCQLAIERAGETIGCGWRLALTLILSVRRWLFLPWLSCATLMLVINRGGDALSVCFNTLALLFLHVLRQTCISPKFRHFTNSAFHEFVSKL